MQLHFWDWIFIGGFLAVSLIVGLSVSRKASKNTEEYFLSGRNMPWWLLGVSMVATTFSSDTPNLVTDLVRTHGVAGNWLWWAFLLTGMLTTFVYANLWRRSNVLTDIEFYELRYSGKPAAFLRGFRAVYLGLFFNTLVMAAVTLAAMKIANIMLGWSPLQTGLIAGLVTVIYSAAGGLRGVLLTDFLQFVAAMTGSILAAWWLLGLPEIGGLANLLAHEEVKGKLSIFPDFSNWELALTIFIIPLAVQWWSVWYPGSEPGGGSYIAQRMLAARDEQGAAKASLFFNVAHYALRPWPWIIVALCSLVIFPDIASIQEAFPDMPADKTGHDLGYPAMLTFLPPGLLGLVMASLIAAYMSTASTQLNLGASYLVNDFYQRFMKPEASQRELVFAGRVSTVLLMVLSVLLALSLQHALEIFSIILQVGAGTGLIFILRWFWWRINAWAELSGMAISFAVALYLQIVHPVLPLPPIDGWLRLVTGVAVTTIGWLTVMYLTRPTDKEKLYSFYKSIQPGGPGWKKIISEAASEGEDLTEGRGEEWSVPTGILCMLLGCVGVYAAIFATGYWIYGKIGLALTMTIIAIAALFLLSRAWTRLRLGSSERDRVESRVR
ncbi:MAG TPA: sodium:solute symporter family protein [Opitutales bacterium]|nr:sodium:solute symporter family protein [Opitutales bacterium]